jgi:methionyl-tRNA formyltransferase
VSSPKIALVGSVSFSRTTLEALLRHGAHVVGVLGLDRSASEGVSDYAPLDDVAAASGVPHRAFVKVNDAGVVEQVRAWAPDLLFVVGLSQLIHAPMMAIPPMGAVGFHPTPLPRGRGRAPVAWLTWDAAPGAASFFVLEEEADAGAIFVQEPFDVPAGAYAGEVVQQVRDAITRALDRWLPRLLAGEWNPIPQDEAAASFWGRRAAEDGWIDWTVSAAAIARLVRTASHPYPGAYTYFRDRKLFVWRASLVNAPFRGVTARVQHVAPDGSFVVQTGDGLLRVEEFSWEGGDGPKIAAGHRLGYGLEDEIRQLKARLNALETRE